GRLRGRDVPGLRIPQNPGIVSLAEIVQFYR
ncbi:MAG: hypothetical protein XU14_C0081G0008, partial [Armatimonadetes bacterium CSP1-3]